jgi:hypothetical protein
MQQDGKRAKECGTESRPNLAHRIDSAGGQYLATAPLQPASMAMANNKRLATDGPFAETREVLGG